MKFHLADEDTELTSLFDEEANGLHFFYANETFLNDEDPDYDLKEDEYSTDSTRLDTDNFPPHDEDKEPLYDGASVSVGAFMLLISLFSMKHNLVGDGVMQLLNIISIALPTGHRLCTSLHAYRTFFRKLRNPLVYHHYCNFCLGYLKDKNATTCPYDGCLSKFQNKTDKPYFLEMPVDDQVRNLLSQKGFYGKLQERFNRSAGNGTFRDIYDGQLYKSYVQNNGPLSFLNNISFTFNTDGAPVFKSSKVSIWPLFLVINELPYKIIMMKENMILAGLWFGNQKPAMGTFLYPFLDMFRKMQNGFECLVPELGKITAKAFLLCGTADLPARSLVCNSVQYNGAFSCWKCEQKGETATRGKGHAHVFPYIESDPKGPKRTEESVSIDAKKAMDNIEKKMSKYTVNGIKGPTWLSFFPRFDIIEGIAIDYMHGVLLGVQKLLLSLWFGAEFKGKKFNFHNRIDEVDKRLSELSPSLDITRMPRSIQNDLKYWKASEFRSFLLFYGGPVLHGILDTDRFGHFNLLSTAVQLMLKNGSTEQDICKAETMLFEFCYGFDKLYDPSFMTLNIHQLVHMADSVRSLGPLYTHSCFSFEDKNGFILKMIRGTQNVDQQIITGICFVQKIPELKQNCIENPDSIIAKICNAIEHPNLLKRGEKIKENVYVLGALKRRCLLTEEYNSLWDFLGSDPINNTYLSFNRLELREQVVYGIEYARMIKRDNSTIMYNEGNNTYFARVKFFIVLDINDKKSSTLAFVEVLHCPRFTSDLCILKVNKTNRMKFVRLEHIIESCMFLTTCDAQKFYVCRFPNKLESD